MKRNLATLFTIMMAANLFAQEFPQPESPPAQSEMPTYEIGVILGFPTGLSGKYWQNNRSAFDAALSWNFGDDASFEVHADYLYHPIYFNVPQGNLPLYVGGGVAVYLTDDPTVGARIPVGLEYLFNRAPLSVFLELAPVVEIIPSTGFTMSGGLGVRYTF